ncbi:IS630 family transposase [Bernardetia litoralis]|uniref:IS630 family transposase n=1 Tax=Bernardetia litoralis TaxID=999 RepID=UPI001FE22955|nr:IS630 family transposase [Bernardetia litoralis]
MTSNFLAQMELILRLYLLPYDAKRPVVCFDERPCFLIGNSVEGIEMKKGSPAKENYAYTKHGSCSLLAMIEPKTGKRLVHVRRKRRKIEFATFMQTLSELYPEAEKIIVVLDNLNTHSKSTFYEQFDAQIAAALADRFEFVFTPKSASWLNMIEIEFSALSRQCLNRRISSINELGKEVFAYFKDRNDKAIKIEWQFSRQKARQVMNRHYEKVNSTNLKYK